METNRKIKMSLGYKIVGAICSLFLLYLCVHFAIGMYNRRLVRKNPILTKAIIINTSAGKGGYSFSYIYEVEQNIYKGGGGYVLKKDRFKIGDTCLILYYKLDPALSITYKDDSQRLVIIPK